MKAKRLFYKKEFIETEDGEELVIVVEILRVPNKNDALINKDLLISLLARVVFPPEINKKILVDVHNNKEIHIHVNEDKKGRPIGLKNVREIFSFFEKEVNRHFNLKKEFKI